MRSLYIILFLLGPRFLYGGNDKFVESFDKGNYKKCLKQCEKTIQKDRNNLDAYLYKSLCQVYLYEDEEYRKENRILHELAIRNLLLLKKKDRQGNFIENHQAQVDTIITKVIAHASRYADDGRFSKAYKLLDDIISLNNNSLAHYAKAMTLKQEGKDREAFNEMNFTARKIYQDTKSGKLKQAVLPEAFVELANYLSEEKAWAEAYIILQRAIEIFGKAEALEEPYFDLITDHIRDFTRFSDSTEADSILHEIVSAQIILNDDDIFDLKWRAFEQILPILSAQDLFSNMKHMLSQYATDKEADYPPFEAIMVDVIAVLTKIPAYGEPDFSRSTSACRLLLDQYTNWFGGSEEEAAIHLAGEYLHAGRIDEAGKLLGNCKLVVRRPEMLKPKEDELIEVIIAMTAEEKDQHKAWLNMYFWDVLFRGNKMLNDQHYAKLVNLIVKYIDDKDFSKAGEMINNALSIYPEDEELMLLKREWVVKDFDVNFAGTSIGYRELGWTGSADNCDAGTLPEKIQQKLTDRLNYFRRLAGVPDQCVLVPELNERAQAAALIMHANHLLNHHPKKDYECYTELGYRGASSANLSLGANSTGALASQMRDAGSNNTSVGHRRWILNPRNKSYGHGSTSSSMALVVFGQGMLYYDSEITDIYTKKFVSWPPPDFVPAPLVYARWSFSLTAANFNDADIKMWDEFGKSVPLKILEQDGGYGMNTIVWEPEVPYLGSISSRTYKVEITGVKPYRSDELHDYSYQVTILNMMDN